MRAYCLGWWRSSGRRGVGASRGEDPAQGVLRLPRATPMLHFLKGQGAPAGTKCGQGRGPSHGAAGPLQRRKGVGQKDQRASGSHCGSLQALCGARGRLRKGGRKKEGQASDATPLGALPARRPAGAVLYRRVLSPLGGKVALSAAGPSPTNPLSSSAGSARSPFIATACDLTGS